MHRKNMNFVGTNKLLVLFSPIQPLKPRRTHLMKTLKKSFKQVTNFFTSEKTKIWLKVMLVLTVMLGCRQALATDLLEGTTDDMKETLEGSGRKWLILIDFALAAAMYIKTKNVMMFLGVLVITIAITNILPAFY
ncbi:hypothetical protein FJ366_04290 [Candidatus Dependentiae bacterium]|nr:hypothetical protein [Candidatus Dependentiae bacterium]